MIRVLVVDDSVFLRRTLPCILKSDSEIKVVGTAADGAEALQMGKNLRPDVVTLHLMMPVMDGLTALKHIMREVPTPVLIVSATSREGARENLEALALGAIDFVTNPSGPVSLDIDEVRGELVDKVRMAYASKIKTAARVDVTREAFRAIVDRLAGERPQPVARPLDGPGIVENKRLVAIAASTGGPTALRVILPRLPADLSAGLVIVLNIAPGFTSVVADRLDELSPITVREATDGARITPGVALLSPADLHTTVMRTKAGLAVELGPEPADATHRPSADVLSHSIAKCCPHETCAVILTGMGEDGASGLHAIHENGGYTVAQDEAPRWFTACLEKR